MRILVVDDELTSRLVLEGVLSEYGTVDACHDGIEAVEAARRALDEGSPYALICLDVLMPGMNGLDALQHIRAEEERRGLDRARGAKVIMITALGDGHSIDSAFRQLCDAYIVKPINAAELLDMAFCLCPLEERVQ